MFFLLLKTIIKIIKNKLLYSSGVIGIKASFVNKNLFNLKSYIAIFLIVSYIFWFLLCILFQIFFHYIRLQADAINLLIILFGLLTLCFYFGYTVNEDVRKFAILSFYPLQTKKKLVLMNEYLCSFIISSFILILSLPFLIMQTVLNGFTGFLFMSKFLGFVLLTGLMIGFVKFIAYSLQEISNRAKYKLVNEIIYILICLLSFHYRDYIKEFITFFIKTLMAGKLVQEILKLVPKSINLYYFSFGYKTLLIVFSLIIILFYISIILIQLILIEKGINNKFPLTKNIKIKSLYIFTNFLSKYGVININFLITFFGSIILVSSLPISIISLSVINAYILVNLFLNENQSNIVLFCKRNHSSILKTSFMFSVYPQIQFLIMFLIIFNSFQSFFSMIHFLIIGLIMIICCIFVYCSMVYSLEKFCDNHLLGTLGKYSILMLLIINFIINIFTFRLNAIFLMYVIPIISASILKIFIINNINKFRGLINGKIARSNKNF